MIGEIFEYILSGSPFWAYRKGYVQKSISLKSRHKRQARAWSSHLENSKKNIREFLFSVSEQSRILVFGSGYLYDFPKDRIPHFEWIFVDVVHPREVRAEFEDLVHEKKVQFINMDLNEASHETLSKLVDSATSIISLNILSQLVIGDEDLQIAESKILKHLNLLNKKKSLLICDYEKCFYSKDDELLIQQASCHSYPKQVPKEKWVWNLAPLGEISSDYRVELKVGAFYYNLSTR